MKKLGVAWIISVSAVGSLQEKCWPCDIVLVDQFVDRTKQSSAHTFFGRGIVAHVSFAHPISEELRQLLLQTARDCEAQVHDGGTYVCMEGPAFSTRAESLTNHRAGYDVIGMTNLGEAKCAREAEIAYATLAMSTDYDRLEGRRARHSGNDHRQSSPQRGPGQKNRRPCHFANPGPTGLAVPFRTSNRDPDRQKTLAEENCKRVKADSGEVSVKSKFNHGWTRIHTDKTAKGSTVGAAYL